VGQFMPQAMQQIKADEVIGEVFGALGYRDGRRFFEMGENDPRVMGMMQQIQQLQQQLESNMAEAQLKAQIEREKMQLEADKFRVEQETDYELKMAELASKEGLTLEQLRQKLQLEAEKIQAQREIKGVEAMNKQNELQFKATTGRQGI